MNNQKDIIEAIAEYLTLPVADLDTDASLQIDLGLNPVQVADLLENLSSKFNIIFESYEVGQVKTVGDLIDLVEDKLLE